MTKKLLTRESYRLQGWDYSNTGYYFVTIYTANKIRYFGEIINGKLILNDIGKIANKFWLEIPKHCENTFLDEFIVMPNHIHGIIYKIKYPDVAMQRPYNQNQSKMARISPKSNSLSIIIRSYKSITTKTIHKQHPDIHFAWQPRYYDRIIHNDIKLNTIHQYINHNPQNWETDENHPNNIRSA